MNAFFHMSMMPLLIDVHNICFNHVLLHVNNDVPFSTVKEKIEDPIKA